MYAVLGLFAVLGCVSAKPAVILGAADDGQWHPELDGSATGSGFLRWGIEDGSWKPELDGSWLGRGDLAWLDRRKRDVDPNSHYQPADEPAVAHAKNALLRQQYTEGQRNILGGGVPADLPADTPEVAAAKQAHAVTYEKEKLATGVGRYAIPAHQVSVATPAARVYTTVAHVATPVVARAYAPVATPVVARAYAPVATNVVARAYAPVAAPVARIATPVHVAAPIATVARTVTPLAHFAAPAPLVTPYVRAVSPYHYAYTPVVQVFKK